MKKVLAIFLYLLGCAVNFYSGFCLLGGPDGAILSKGSFAFGLPAVFVSLMLFYSAMKIIKAGVYLFLPILIVISSWFVAIVITQYAGFYTWLYGVPISAAVALVALLMQKKCIC